MTTETSEADGKIVCLIDNGRTHLIENYLKQYHPSWTLDRYKETYPDAPIMSPTAQERLRVMREQKAKEAEREMTANLQVAVGDDGRVLRSGYSKQALATAFDLGSTDAAKNGRGEPIQITVFEREGQLGEAFIPDIDKRYIFDIELLKNVLLGLELGMPVYLWGYHGTGKTTILEQVAARTGRPFLRVQHTINTEEAHILGQYVVRGGQTVFQLGPLPIAMQNGYVYLADEYDFAMPSVTAVYQPVLEGKALVIKDAPEELRVIKPHKNFRFCATGNTNGVGDETGLYQGTLMQNAANYSRFSIVEEVAYMSPDVEAAVIANQSGCKMDVAKKFVDIATEVRKLFKAGKIGTTISPRELINSAAIGMRKGSKWRDGLRLGYMNRCSRADKETVDQYAQRIFT